MTRKKSGLGKGLEALIPGAETEILNEGLTRVAIDEIEPNPRQPRSRFDPGELAELAASIQEHGIIQPLILAQNSDRSGYTLIAGERRLQAAQKAGLRSVLAIIREASEQDMLEIALIENVQRADLNPIETAVAYRQLSEDFKLSHEEIAQRVGKSRVAVTNTLRLLKVSMPVLQAVVDRKVTEGHARALLGLANPEGQLKALQAVIKDGLTVRQTEEMVRRLNIGVPEKRVRSKPPEASPEIKALEDQLRSNLGTRVRIKDRGKGGTLTIHYYSNEELTAIIERMLMVGEPEFEEGDPLPEYNQGEPFADSGPED